MTAPYGVVVLTADATRLEQVRQAIGPDNEVREAEDLKSLSDAMLWDDSEVVVLDVDHPKVDPLEAVRLVKGTRWDVRLVCIGSGQGAQRAERGGATVEGPDAWGRLRTILAS